MVEPAHIDAARREALRLVLQRRTQGRRRLVPFRLVVKLDQMPVRIAETEGRAVAEFALMPADLVAGALQRLDPPLQRLRAARPEGDMAEARCVRARQLERVALVVVPGAQVDGVALPAALGHAEHVDEEAQAFFRLGGEQFQMAQMGHVHDRFIMHGVLSCVRTETLRRDAGHYAAPGAMRGVRGSSRCSRSSARK